MQRVVVNRLLLPVIYQAALTALFPSPGPVCHDWNPELLTVISGGERAAAAAAASPRLLLFMLRLFTILVYSLAGLAFDPRKRWLLRLPPPNHHHHLSLPLPCMRFAQRTEFSPVQEAIRPPPPPIPLYPIYPVCFFFF